MSPQLAPNAPCGKCGPAVWGVKDRIMFTRTKSSPQFKRRGLPINISIVTPYTPDANSKFSSSLTEHRISLSIRAYSPAVKVNRIAEQVDSFQWTAHSGWWVVKSISVRSKFETSLKNRFVYLSSLLHRQAFIRVLKLRFPGDLGNSSAGSFSHRRSPSWASLFAYRAARNFPRSLLGFPLSIDAFALD